MQLVWRPSVCLSVRLFACTLFWTNLQAELIEYPEWGWVLTYRRNKHKLHGSSFLETSLQHMLRGSRHITPIPRDLHWLKSPERIDFKIGVLVYRCLHGLAPLYLSDYFERIADTNRRRLRSSSSSLLAVRRTRLSTVGDRAFPVIGSRFWNTLPDSVTSASSLSVFRSRLKSHLFERSFLADSYWHLPPVLTPDSRTVV